jgi:hypothetical protein
MTASQTSEWAIPARFPVPSLWLIVEAVISTLGGILY